jgi:DNA polymerase-3 subunit chi
VTESATEVLFYQLERQPLDRILPGLLEKTLERGWRAVVQAGSKERLEALDALLWTFSEESFLPHGTASDGFANRQPVFLTLEDANPNGAQVRFYVDGAACAEFSGYERIVCLFDGRDEDARGVARQQWKAARDSGAQVTYWQQNDRGRWEKKA